MRRFPPVLVMAAAGLALVLPLACGRPPANPASSASSPRLESPLASASTLACASHDLPAARADASMAYMTSLGLAVLFGGDNSNAVFLGDTWTWKDGCWTVAMSSGPSPSPRIGMAMAYDPTRKAVIAFGGRTDPSKQIFSAETWAWDGLSWSLLSASGPQLHFGLAAFDPTAGRVLLYGSTNGVSSTWTWDGAKWNAIAGQSPPERSQASMASDPLTGEPMLFGGVSHSPPANLNDTWTWDGDKWALRAPLHSPPARFGAAMATSSSNRLAVLIGGQAGPVIFGDAWTWSGTDWAQTVGFGQRIGAVAVDLGTKVLLFGGVDSAKNSFSNDSATWDGSSWTPA
jgi:hypothetical protein